MDHDGHVSLILALLQRAPDPTFNTFLQQPLIIRNRALREPSDMARDREIWDLGFSLADVGKQRTRARPAGLCLHHIRGSPGDPAFSQGARQSGFVDNPTTRNIDDQSLGSHAPQFLLRDEVDGIVILGKADTDDGGAFQRLVETHTAVADLGAILTLTDQNLFEPNGLCQLGDAFPQRPVAQHGQRLLTASQRRTRRPKLGKRAFIDPIAGARHGIMDLDDPLPGAQVQREKMLAHGVNITGGAFGDGDPTPDAVVLVHPADADRHDGQNAQMRRGVHLLGRHGRHTCDDDRGVLDARGDFVRLRAWVYLDGVWEIKGWHLCVDAFQDHNVVLVLAGR